jgi:gliding motility-associated-like protein
MKRAYLNTSSSLRKIWCSLFPKLCIFVVLMFVTLKANSQQIYEVQDNTPASGQMLIEWIPSTDQTIDGYILYHYYKYGQWSSIDTIKGFQNNSFNFNPANYGLLVNDSVYFFIVETYKKIAGKINIDTSGLGLKPWTDSLASNILLKAEYDSCNYAINVSWNTFRGWGNVNKLNYPYVKIGNGNYQQNPSKGIKDTFYTFTNILPDTDYCIYSEIVRQSDGVTCISNTVCLSTRSSMVPSYINNDVSDARPTNQIMLMFSIDPNTQLKKYVLLKTQDTTKGYKTIDTLIANGDNINYTDTAVNTTQYYYKLAALNYCGKQVAVSPVMSNLVLTASIINNSTASLSWTPFPYFLGNVKEYNIYRIRNGTPEMIGSITTTSFGDQLDTLKNQGLSEQICYYIEAVEEGNPHDINGTAFSNTACVNVIPSIGIPDVILPNENQNNYFRALINFLPKEYLLIIYDRWGNKLFETKDVNPGWDGKVSGGKNAAEGVYIYYLKITGFDNNSVIKKGTFSVVYQ